MKIAIITLTYSGFMTSLLLKKKYAEAVLFAPQKLQKEVAQENNNFDDCDASFFEGELRSLIPQLFFKFDAFIFVMATGIVVRMIAPYLVDKTRDPGVVVVDDKGRYAVSLLSGHLGGANDLAEEVAKSIGAVPVVTTATDGQGIISFDLLARRMGWTVECLTGLKQISAGQISGKPVLLYIQDKITFDLPVEHVKINQQELYRLQKGNISSLDETSDIYENYEWEFCGVVFLSNTAELPQLSPKIPFVALRPRNITAGVGCRSGVSPDRLIHSLKEAFVFSQKSLNSLSSITTVEEKAREPALIEAANHFGVPLKIIKKEEIARVEHLFNSSELVQKHLGIGSVCEPCAYLGSGRGDIILEKKSFGGITIALGEGYVFATAFDEHKGIEG